MTVYKWSQTAANDATADPSINWAEGQAPSSVNDSGRAMMAAIAKYRDDISGQTITTGTSSAYVISSYQAFDTLAHMSGALITFFAHSANTGACTLNVDGLGAKPLVFTQGVDLPAGSLISGTAYMVTYRNDIGTPSFLLHGFYGNPYNIPLAGGMDYWGTTVPNSSFAFPIGQAISRSTYSALFAIMGTTYGVGDGSTTFNLPDKTGRVSAMKEASATRLTSTYFGGNSTTMGAVGGAESQTLTLAQIPTGITSPVTVTSNVANLVSSSASAAIISYQPGATLTTTFPNGTTITVTSAVTSAGTATSNNTSGNAHTIVQPTIVCNYIMRII